MIAAIDVGSNSIRMCIAEARPNGTYVPVESLTMPVRLGVDTFSVGRLSPRSIRSACEAMQGFQQALKAYRVKELRAVATSSVRDATNADTFIDRVQVAAGIRLEVLDGMDETRLTYGMLRGSLAAIADFDRTDTMLLDLGAGSAEITIFHNGRIVFSESRRIGTLRLREMLGAVPQGKLPQLLEPLVRNVVESVERLVPLRELRNFVLVSADAWHLNLHRPAGGGGSNVAVIPRDAFQAAAEEAAGLSMPELVDRYGLNVEECETLTPALIATNTFLAATPAPEVRLLRTSMLDALLTSMARGVQAVGGQDDEFERQVTSCAVALGRKYHIDEAHASRVSDFAVGLFDQLQGLHGLGGAERTMLRVAGILHDVGFYVSTRQHHKHSMYLVANSECFGVTVEQMQLISIVCRYHRRAIPRPQHTEYMQLTRDNRLLVSKLAAMLRIADSLDRSHRGDIRAVQARVGHDQLVLEVESEEDLSLDEMALQDKGDLFEELYGLEVVMRRASGDGAI